MNFASMLIFSIFFQAPQIIPLSPQCPARRGVAGKGLNSEDQAGNHSYLAYHPKMVSHKDLLHCSTESFQIHQDPEDGVMRL